MSRILALFMVVGSAAAADWTPEFDERLEDDWYVIANSSYVCTPLDEVASIAGYAGITTPEAFRLAWEMETNMEVAVTFDGPDPNVKQLRQLHIWLIAANTRPYCEKLAKALKEAGVFEYWEERIDEVDRGQYRRAE